MGSNLTEKLADLVKVIRKIDPEMPAQSVAALIFISQTPGLSQFELAAALGLSSSAVTRIAARLGEWERMGKPGLKLLVNEIDPRDRRHRQLWLTPKGQKFIADMSQTIA